MITGRKEDLNTYKGLSERIDKAIDYILNLDESIAPGKYEIDGKDVYVSIIEKETSSMDNFKFEAHKNYLDLQYIISGGEIMVYAPVSDCEVITEYNAEKDVYFLNGDKRSEMKLSAGEFYLVHPFDAHAPGKGYETMNFKKAVVKIKL